MSDSENDLLSNPFHYQSDITVVSAKGPNINTGNMSFRNNFSSTLQLPRTFEPYYDPRSGYSRREPSPMSVASACDARYRNFNVNNSHYRGMSSQRSMYNGRSGSPMSVRTLDSTASVSATDIAMALKHVKFNNYDMRIIKEAFNSLMKKKSRKKIEKRRNLKLFLKGKRRRSGYDSGEQASDSSLSSDNGRSIRTGFEENMSSCRSTKTDLVAEIRKTIREDNIYKDCTANFRQNSFRKAVNGPGNLNDTQASTGSMTNPLHSFHAPRLKNSSSTQSLTSFQTQKERFQNGYVLPSQRFNKSVVTQSIPEITCAQNDDADSDYDLFSGNKNQQTYNDNRKRSITEEDIVTQNNKRAKVISPCKISTDAKKATKELTNKKITEKSNEFQFAKPIMPVKKFKEKLISKSGPLIPEVVIEPPKNVQSNENRISKEANLDNETPDLSNITQNSDVSMRPSFIKRKLFTQKLDVTENKNQSADNINSPQNSIYSAIQKEKHKARKLVTNQSCLSRDVGQDDSNLLDLIHKIVPANCMNVTTQSHVQKANTNHDKSIDSDKFDVTSMIKKKIDDDMSDTFTDEEIFNGDSNNKIKEILNQKTKENTAKKAKNEKTKAVEKIKTVEKAKPNDVNKVKKTAAKETVKEAVENFNQKACRVTIEKIPTTNVQIGSDNNGLNKPKCWSTFWDLDSESDIESINPKQNQFKDSSNVSIDVQGKSTSIGKGIGAVFKKPSDLNTSTMSVIDTTQRLNIPDFKIKSHRSPKVKKCNEVKGNTIKSYFETSSRMLYDTPIEMDHKKSEENLVQKANAPNNIKTQKDTKPASTKKAKKTPQKDKPNKNTKVNEEKTPIKGKSKNQKEPKTKNLPQKTKDPKVKTPARRGRPPKSETQTRAVSEKEKQKTPVKVKDKTKDKKIDNNEVKLPKKNEMKTLKDNTKENQEPNKKQSNTKPFKNQDNNKNTQKIILESSVTNSPVLNENNKVCRAIRSCRLSKNSTLNSSKDSFNLTMTLRSRYVDLSESLNKSRMKQNVRKENKCKRIK